MRPIIIDDGIAGYLVDVVITVCDEANEVCPVFLGVKKRWHWSLPDPSKATGAEEEQLAVYQHVRDTLRTRIEHELLNQHEGDTYVSGD